MPALAAAEISMTTMTNTHGQTTLRRYLTTIPLAILFKERLQTLLHMPVTETT
jgi:hypothetical protein